LRRLPQGLRLRLRAGARRAAIRFRGKSVDVGSEAANGNIAVRNFCPTCGGLVFGGVIGESHTINIYAGSLDDPSLFHPTAAIFVAGRPERALIPPGLRTFDALPPG
jgi:hypothetical protein